MRVIFQTWRCSTCPVRPLCSIPQSVLRCHRAKDSKHRGYSRPGTNTQRSMPGRSPSNEAQKLGKVRGIFSPRSCRLVLCASVQCSSVRETFWVPPVSFRPTEGPFSSGLARVPSLLARLRTVWYVPSLVSGGGGGGGGIPRYISVLCPTVSGSNCLCSE
ncbi:hypothetical protein LIA77_03347 [Sarocladium implicatum]|nr:hypothetical protein LIA77_03347 [Sarocladium implicatum]